MQGFVRFSPVLLLACGCGRTVLDEGEPPSTMIMQGGSTSATGGAQAGGKPASTGTGGGWNTGGKAGTGGGWNTGGKAGTGGTPITGGKAGTGGTPIAGGMTATGGKLAAGGAATGGSSSTGSALGGAIGFGGALSGGASSSGGLSAGGSAIATSPAGGFAAGGIGDGGMPTTGGNSGIGDPHMDPAGDATDPSGDLLEAHVYVGGETLEVQIRFAALPVPENQRTQITIASATDPIDVLIDRYSGELLVRSVAANATISYETCSTTRVNATTGWLSVTLPLAVVPDARLVKFAISSAYATNEWDTMDAGWLAVDPDSAPDRGAVPVCEPSSRVRKSTVRFRDVSLGWDFGCGLDLTAAAVCWGSDEAMGWVGTVPQGAFEQIAVSNQWATGRVYACGRRADDSVECWGDRPPQVTPVQFVKISEPYGCGILQNGMTLGTSDDGQSAYLIDKPSGTVFVDVTGFGGQHCGLRSDGVISCTSGILPPTGNDFVAVELGTDTDACGLHADGTLECGEGRMPPLVFKQIDSPDPGGNLHFGCGVQPSGAPMCWGGAGTVVPVVPGPFKRIEVSSSGEGVCGFKDDDTLECWHYSYVAGNPIPATTPP